MGFDLSADDLKVFLEEAEEQLQLLEEDIVKLEQRGEDDALLQEIFRAAHTLKGSSATLGHQRMAELTHAMENLLDKLRKHQVEVSSELIDALFRCLDGLSELKEEIATEETREVDLAVLIMGLQAMGAETGKAPEPPAPPTGEAAEPEDLGWQAKQRLAEAREQGEKTVRILIAIDPKAPMPSVRAFQVLLKLGEVGEVVWTRPTQAEIEDEQVHDRLVAILIGDVTPGGLAAALSEVPEVELRVASDLSNERGTSPGTPAEQAAAPGRAAPAPVQAAAAQAASREAGRPGVPGGEGGPAARAAGGEGGSQALRRSGRSVRVDVEVLDNLMNLVGELVIDRTRLTRLVGQIDATDHRASGTGEELGRTASHIGRVSTDLQEEIMRARMLPVENLFKKFPRMVRDLAQAVNKEIEFVIRGEETELDRSVIEEIGDPVMHLLRNSVDHGVEDAAARRAAGKPEKGLVTLEASHEENSIVITVRDDGRGIDPERIRRKAVEKGLLGEEAARRADERELLDLIFAPGFSTAEQVTEVSGRGVGMDVVHKNLEKLNGSIEIKTAPGKGTEFRIKLPLTLAIIRALLVDMLGEIYAIPLVSVLEAIHITPADIKTIQTREVIIVRGRVLPLVRLERVFLGLERETPPEGYAVVLISLRAREFGLAVDRLVGEQEVVIKSLGKFIGEVPGVSGATILGDGGVSLILDMASLGTSVPWESRTA